MSRRTPAARHAARTAIVPRTLVLASSAGAPIEELTSTCAARWKTTSGWTLRNARSTASESRTSTTCSCAPSSSAEARFSRLPWERSSRMLTVSPRSSSASTRWDPMNPAPPVTRHSMARRRLCGRRAAIVRPMTAVCLTVDTEFPDRPARAPLGSLHEVLAVLSDGRVRATFFLVGAWADAHPAEVERIRDAGHHIGNHSYCHCTLTRLTEGGIVEDLTACGDALARHGVEARPWFRAPYGEVEHPVVDVAAVLGRAGYRHLHWHADGEDWRPGNSAEEI